MLKRLGFIVNPIAGMGGAVGLKGTDGPALAEARRRGAVEVASARALQALRVLAERRDRFTLLTAAGRMGEDQARAAGLAATVVYVPDRDPTGAEHSAQAAMSLHAAGAELLLFAGGDGTAHDLFSAVGASVPMVGIPAGVKMHSAVFGTSPASAARLALAFLDPGDRARDLRDVEIMDGDGHGATRLYGYARAPHAPFLRQLAKATSRGSDDADLDAACREVVAAAADDYCTIVGPGTTMQRIKDLLGGGTLLGIDVYCQGRPVGLDLGARKVARFAAEGPARIVVGVVGGQGCLFGRGNQQIDAATIRAVGKERILVVSDLGKLLALEQGCLFVDTGDASADRMLSGYIKILTGPGKSTMMRVAAPALADEPPPRSPAPQRQASAFDSQQANPLNK